MALKSTPFAVADDQSPSCRRCGICCLKGGPTLTDRDIPLVVSGVLTLEALVCLRSGEWAWDEVLSGVRPLARERIKVAGLGGKACPWRCCFYLEGAGCSIYARRPVQCVALFCMDTRPLEELLALEVPPGRTGVLAALEALEEIPGVPALGAGLRKILPDMVLAHEEQNPVRPVLDLAASLGFRPQAGEPGDARRGESHVLSSEVPGRAEALARLGEAARTDAAFRELCVAQAGIPRSIVPFLLGRPLVQLLAEVGLHPSGS